MTVTDADLNRDARPAGLLPRHVKGLLWREWLAQRRLIVGALAVYLTLGWVLLIFFHPGFIIAFGVILAVLAAAGLGGADSSEGSEEFAFSLPPTRGERYLVRLALGGATVLALTILGTLSIALDLPQMLWGVFVQTGFTEPFPKVDSDHLGLYPLSVAFPFAAFAFTFVLASLARTRGVVVKSSLLGVFGAVIIGNITLYAEDRNWSSVNGWISVPALILLGAGALVLGYFLYLRKEGIARPAPLQAGSGWWVLIIAVVAVFVLIVLLGAFLYGAMVAEPSHEEQRQRDAREAGQSHVRPDNPTAQPAPEEGR